MTTGEIYGKHAHAHAQTHFPSHDMKSALETEWVYLIVSKLSYSLRFIRHQ